MLIDYKLPRMNGFELYKEIRKIDDKVKVCFITAFDVDHGEIKKEFQSSLNTTQRDKAREKRFGCKMLYSKTH